jgi:acetyltransferase-like isoleucine patch superfamily enzyme
VTIYSYNHNFKCPEQLPYDSRLILEPVHIGNYVWIGMNATIAPGSVIGDGAIIGMGTVVSGSIPENAIVVNSKPRIVGFRDPGLTKNLADKGAFFRADDYNV